MKCQGKASLLSRGHFFPEGEELKFSLTAFFATQLMPAVRPVYIAASRTVLTSLLSDNIYIIT